MSRLKGDSTCRIFTGRARAAYDNIQWDGDGGAKMQWWRHRSNGKRSLRPIGLDPIPSEDWERD